MPTTPVRMKSIRSKDSESALSWCHVVAPTMNGRTIRIIGVIIHSIAHTIEAVNPKLRSFTPNGFPSTAPSVRCEDANNFRPKSDSILCGFTKSNDTVKEGPGTTQDGSEVYATLLDLLSGKNRKTLSPNLSREQAIVSSCH